MVNPRKAYPVDPWLIPLYEQSGRPNLGHALETVVMVELIRVFLDVSDPSTRKREVRAPEAASKELPDAKPLLLPLDSTPPQPPMPEPLHWKPASAWLPDWKEEMQ